MAEPIFDRPITRDQRDLAKQRRNAVLRRAKALADKNGEKTPTLQGANVINQQDYVNSLGTDFVNNWKNDVLGTAKANIKDTYSWIPSLYNKVTLQNPNNQLTQQEAIDKFIPWASKDAPAEKNLNKYLIPKQFRTAKGGFVSGVGKEIRKRYQAYKQDAVKYGKEPASYSQFLAFNTSDAAKNQLQANTGIDITPIMQKRLAIYNKRKQLTDLTKNAPDEKTRRAAHQQLLQLGSIKQEVDKQLQNLRTIDKFRYYFTPMGTTALAAPVVAKMALPMIGFQGVRRYISAPLANKVTDAITKDDVALGNAMVTGNTYLLNDRLKQKLKALQEQRGLPQFSNDKATRLLWAAQGKRLLDSAGNWKKGGQLVGDVIPMMLNPGNMLQTGLTHGGRAAFRGGIKYGLKKGLQAVPSQIKNVVRHPGNIKKVVSPSNLVLGGLQGGGTYALMQTPSVSAQHQVVSGAAPVKEIGKLLKDQNIPDTPQNRIAVWKAIKAEKQTADSSYNGWIGDAGARLGSPWIKSAFDKDIKDRIALAGLPEKDLEKALPQFIRNQQAAQQDPMRQAIFKKWRQVPENRQYVKKQLQTLSPKQYLQLLNLNDMRAQKQGAYLPSKSAQQNTAWITEVATQAATDNYSEFLGQQDPDKFYAGMQQWMPLIHKIGGASGDSPLKAATQKAVWAHVKKNPFFINKAMSIWAMSNGFNSLADFLGSNGAFYGTIGAIGIGLPLTISLIKSLFGGSSNPQQPVQQAPLQGYQPLAYAPRGITERGLIVG